MPFIRPLVTNRTRPSTFNCLERKRATPSNATYNSAQIQPSGWAKDRLGLPRESQENKKNTDCIQQKHGCWSNLQQSSWSCIRFISSRNNISRTFLNGSYHKVNVTESTISYKRVRMVLRAFPHGDCGKVNHTLPRHCRGLPWTAGRTAQVHRTRKKA